MIHVSSMGVPWRVIFQWQALTMKMTTWSGIQDPFAWHGIHQKAVQVLPPPTTTLKAMYASFEKMMLAAMVVQLVVVETDRMLTDACSCQVLVANDDEGEGG